MARRPRGPVRPVLWHHDPAIPDPHHHDWRYRPHRHPDTTILPPLHLQITGDADYSFTVPDIPIPAIHIGINGVVTVGFTAPEATLLSALKNNGSFISFGPITLSNIDIPPMDFTLGLPVLGPITGQLGPIHLEPIVVAGIGVPLEIEPIPWMRFR